MEEALQRLLDLAAIREVQLRYCRGIDRMDWDLLRTCYHPDATDDHGNGVRDLEGFIAWVKTGVLAFESITHVTGNQLVDIEGDTAFAEHYCVSYHRCPPSQGKPAADLVAVVRFCDQMERRNGEWKIARRVAVVDSQRADPVLGEWSAPGMGRAKRDKTDPSYAR